MAGYSGTPLRKKLGIKDGSRVRLRGAPRGFAQSLGIVPKQGEADVIVMFTAEADELRRHFARLAGWLRRAGGLWIAWPKRASGVATDLTEDEVRRVGLRAGLVDNKVCAIDETW